VVLAHEMTVAEAARRNDVSVDQPVAQTGSSTLARRR